MGHINEQIDYANAFRLDGKSVLVTGAGRGIGAEIANALAQAGAAVMVSDVQASASQDVAEKLAAAGGTTAHCQLDVCNEAHWLRAVTELTKRFGRYDVLVNNAGIETAALLSTCTGEDFRYVMDVNVTGVFLGIKHAIDPMKECGGGAIVNLSSIAGMIGTVGHAAYHASKGAVRSLTKAAAIELAVLGAGIRVNSIHPGIVKTDMGENFIRHFVDLGLAADASSVRSQFEAAHPLGLGAPSDIASAVLYLASDAANWITGSELVIDGGYTAQ